MSSTASRTCPPEEALLAYVSDGRGGDEMLAHLDDCAVCRQLMGEAVRALETDGGAARPGGAHTLADGERVAGRYDVRRFIARGGMGEVYEAYDQLLDETVALKTLTTTALDDDRAALRFKAEARLARRVSHPNVCRILEFGVHTRQRRGGAPESISFLTMEFLAGETLHDRIARRGRPGDAEATSLIRQILAGLGAIHGAGILHRDLKTENVFLVPDPRGGERAVVMDFGLARALDGSIISTWPRSRARVGTLDCMAPEQIEGKPLGVTADVFAMGVLLYEVLTGARPFVNMPPQRRMLAVAAPPSSLRADLPREWDAILARCLALAPGERYPGLDALIAALPGVASARVPAPPPRRGRWLFWRRS